MQEIEICINCRDQEKAGFYGWRQKLLKRGESQELLDQVVAVFVVIYLRKSRNRCDLQNSSSKDYADWHDEPGNNIAEQPYSHV